jgi:FkbM family methyltransferase
MTDQELIELSSSLAYVRPLRPYPMADQLEDWRQLPPEAAARYRIWQFLFESNRSVPLTLPWHFGSHLDIQLGNELSRGLFVHGCHDPNELALLDHILRPGHHFLDIGAHEGVYSVFAALKVGPSGHVWAIEPSRRELSRIRRNVDLNGLDHVDIIACAVGDRDGEIDIKIAADARSGHNTLGEFVWDGVSLARQERVPLRTLDSLVAERGIRSLDVVKIDVEGTESRLLRGGSHVMTALRPIVLFEASEKSLKPQGTSLSELTTLFREAGYTILAIDHHTGLPTRRIGSHSGDNLIAVPKGVDLG